MKTHRIVLLLYCLLMAGAIAHLLAPERKLVAEGQAEVDPAVRAEESPLYLPFVVNQTEIPTGAAVASRPAQTAQMFYADELARAFQRTGDAAPGRLFLSQNQMGHEQLFLLPAEVREAFQFYYTAVEVADWGNVYVAAADVAGEQTYAVLVTTDGDGGFLEVYAADGALLGAAQTDVGVARWASLDAVRRQATGP